MLLARPLGLLVEAVTDQSELGLKFLHGLGRIVHKGEAGGLATTKLCPETENADLLLVRLVHAGELVAELILGDVGAVGVEDIAVRGSIPILVTAG